MRNQYLYLLGFADYQVVIAQELEDLSYMIIKLYVKYTKAVLDINFARTEYLETIEKIEDLQFIDKIIFKRKDSNEKGNNGDKKK